MNDRRSLGRNESQRLEMSVGYTIDKYNRITVPLIIHQKG